MDILKQETDDLYQKLYTQKLSELNTQHLADNNEQRAQKFAIKEAALQLFEKFPTTDKSLIWANIYRAHVARKSGIDISPETIEKVKSADQSWIKSGGHAFEEMVKDLSNNVLLDEGINIHLQRDLSQLLHEGKIKNEGPDMQFIKTNMESSAFDLFTEKDGYVFGVIQAKTSIRDRVTRDREPSLAAMGHFLWSIVFVLDGDFLRLPKFMNMVRGGTDMFPQNGWHGLYAFSLPDSVICDRIYKLDTNLDIFKHHAVQAFTEWKERRQWFDHNWKAKQE
jgi:hypothetical protein